MYVQCTYLSKTINPAANKGFLDIKLQIHTSAILVAQVWKSPHIAETDSKTEKATHEIQMHVQCTLYTERWANTGMVYILRSKKVNYSRGMNVKG